MFHVLIGATSIPCTHASWESTICKIKKNSSLHTQYLHSLPSSADNLMCFLHKLLPKTSLWDQISAGSSWLTVEEEQHKAYLTAKQLKLLKQGMGSLSVCACARMCYVHWSNTPHLPSLFDFTYFALWGICCIYPDKFSSWLCIAPNFVVPSSFILMKLNNTEKQYYNIRA